jgi:hypothetical protein
MEGVVSVGNVDNINADNTNAVDIIEGSDRKILIEAQMIILQNQNNLNEEIRSKKRQIIGWYIFMVLFLLTIIVGTFIGFPLYYTGNCSEGCLAWGIISSGILGVIIITMCYAVVIPKLIDWNNNRELSKLRKQATEIIDSRVEGN